MRVELLIIDPQIDFCDPDKGALYVKGAEHDMARLSSMVRRVGSRLDDIHVTLDSHHLVDIAHPIFWRDSQGNHPDPFTLISVSDVETGKWAPTQPGLYKRALDYVQTLERNGRYVLCIWPPHCLIGSPGHAIVLELFAALQEWEKRFAILDLVTKGSNIMTEHYSAVKAEVPDPEDAGTQINTRLIETLQQADLIAVAGEAGSHCLANTVRDIADSFGDDRAVSKIVLIEDATSPVPGFEKFQDDFLAEMTARGMRRSTTIDFLA
jgi:nicotinamidase/pyrazinamidase